MSSNFLPGSQGTHGLSSCLKAPQPPEGQKQWQKNPCRIYKLVVRQEPKQTHMCGVGSKGILGKHSSSLSHSSLSSADHRLIDPPPIVQLQVIDSTAPHLRSSMTLSHQWRNSTSGSTPGSPTSSAASTIHHVSSPRRSHRCHKLCTIFPSKPLLLHVHKSSQTR